LKRKGREMRFSRTEWMSSAGEPCALKGASTVRGRGRQKRASNGTSLAAYSTKRLTKPGMGFFSFETAGRTLQGYEVMHMIRKGQIRGVGKGDIKDQVIFIASLFGVAA
jgi:transposase-like protein